MAAALEAASRTIEEAEDFGEASISVVCAGDPGAKVAVPAKTVDALPDRDLLFTDRCRKKSDQTAGSETRAERKTLTRPAATLSRGEREKTDLLSPRETS
jgi:hypothetical protein